VFDIRRNRMRIFRAGQERRGEDDEFIDGLDNPEIPRRFGAAFAQASREHARNPGARLARVHAQQYASGAAVPRNLVSQREAHGKNSCGIERALSGHSANTVGSK